MADVEGLDFDLAEVDWLAVGDFVEIGLVQETVLLEPGTDEAQGELGAVDGQVDVAEEIGEAADVVFVAVGNDDAAKTVGVFTDVGEIGDDEVDPEHLGVGEHDAAIDDHGVVGGFEDGAIAADFAESAERNYADGVRAGISHWVSEIFLLWIVM